MMFMYTNFLPTCWMHLFEIFITGTVGLPTTGFGINEGLRGTCCTKQSISGIFINLVDTEAKEDCVYASQYTNVSYK